MMRAFLFTISHTLISYAALFSVPANDIFSIIFIKHEKLLKSEDFK